MRETDIKQYGAYRGADGHVRKVSRIFTPRLNGETRQHVEWWAEPPESREGYRRTSGLCLLTTFARWAREDADGQKA